MLNKSGFTLVELLTVILIIGLLAVIALPRFVNTREKAYYSAMRSDLRNLATAEEDYFAASLTYTTDPNQLASYRTSKRIIVTRPSAAMNRRYNSIQDLNSPGIRWAVPSLLSIAMKSRLNAGNS